jgi:RNA polymerase sigma factor (sigma-70 family)
MGQDFRDPTWLATERQLVERARRGDRAAFGELYSVFAPTIYRQVLLPKLADPASAEDVLAETFISAFSRLSRFSDRGLSIYFWLARIASNKATDLYRSRGRAGRGLANLERLLEPLGQASVQADEDLMRRVDADGLRLRVAGVLERVNPRYRRAIEARFLEGLSRKECAEKLEVKLGTFDVLLLRALRAFRKEWTDG